MSVVTFNARDTRRQIPVNSPNPWYTTSVTWTHPGTTAFRMTELQLCYNPRQDYQKVEIRSADSTQILQTYTAATGGETLQKITITDSIWTGETEQTFVLYFYRNTTPNQSADYRDIHLELTYQAAAGESGVTVALVDAGEAQTVQLINQDAGVYHQVTWAYAGADSHTQTYEADERSVSWAIPAASLPTVYAAVTDRQYITGTVTVTTYLDDGTEIGTTIYDAVLTIPWNSSTRPSLSVTHSETLDAVGQAIHQAMTGWDVIAGHTDITIIPTAQGKYGADIDVIRIYTDEWEDYCNSGDEETYAVETPGTWAVTIRATDSRGIWTEETVTLTPMAAVPPTVQSMTAQRWSSDSGSGHADDEGSYLRIDWTAQAGTPSSAVTATYTVELTGSGTQVDSGTAGSGTVYTDAILQAERGYTLRLTVTDVYGQSSSREVDISSALYTIHRLTGGRGVAFGQACTRQGVEIQRDWQLYAHGSEILQLIRDGAHPPGSCLLTADGGYDPNTSGTDWAELGTLTVADVLLHVWVRTR